MPLDIETQRSVFALAVPEAILVLFACVTFLGGAFRPGRCLWGCVALAGIACAAASMAIWPPPAVGKLSEAASALWPDRLAFLIRVVALTGGAILILLAWKELPEGQAADSFACLLVITAGTSLVGAANELTTLFLALELVSVPTYVLLYLPRAGRPVQEAAIKYFLLSIFSSALLLFGFSYLYGLTGATHLATIHEKLANKGLDPAGTLALLALVLVVGGLGFRLAAVPFHFYAPDVYQGAPICGAATLAFVPKVAAIAGLARVLGLVASFPGEPPRLLSDELATLLWILAAITMTLGNVLALLQDDVKRTLAYSSIAHAGYLLIGVAALRYGKLGDTGLASVLFYLAAYGAMTLGAFGVLSYVGTRDRGVTTVDDLAGLGTTHPGPALLMALFLFSLIGLPATAGFAGKLLVFADAVATGERLYQVLALIGAVNAAIGAYYYLRMVGAMYLRPAVKPLPEARSVPGLVALWACAGLVVWLGVYPWPTLKLAREAAAPGAETAVAAK